MIKMYGWWGPSKPYYNWGHGLVRHGDLFTMLHGDLDPTLVKDADCFYQTNMLKPKFFDAKNKSVRGDKYLYMKESSKPTIVSETTPFRQYGGYMRFGWHSYGWTDANCNNDNVDSTRWNKFEKRTGITFKDWHSPGDYILLMGQKEGDSALINLFNQSKHFHQWVLETILTIRKYTDRPIVFRPHPRTATRGVKLLERLVEQEQLKNVKITQNLTIGGNQGGEGLNNDLNNAYCVVTYNSLSGVESIINGIPVFALDNASMVHPIAHKDLSQIEKLNYNIDLQDWKNKIAYTMWNKEEVSSGECWGHLKSVYFK
jgi:hypothetical protein